VLGLTAEGPAGDEETVGLLEQVARPVAVAVANARAYRRIEALTARLAVEKAYLEEEIRREGRFDDMVGHSLALRDALHLVEAAAATDTTVLVLGETGTGKELVARAVHRLSRRAGRTFVKLNCAAIPTGLLESELFGHERGAFTGAVDRRIGRFELADGGTLFLDEVGDIPVELQAKLLRVLQEQEFERIGSGRTLKVDVRLVAATHRDLPRMVADGRFRADLFYRLHVFPIRLPPLRERADDIPELARHFARVFAQRFGRPAPVVTDELAAALQAYPWPGNVRELEHLIERAVILTNGPELRLPPGGLPAAAAEPADGRAGPASALRSAEREAIRRALDESGGVVGGPHGAAARLGVKRTTLLSMMKRHGLSRPKPPASNR
jgi:formate hydrogenlyase transcriptional activator